MEKKASACCARNDGVTEGLRARSALRLQFQRRFHDPSDSRSGSCKIADIPGQQSIGSRFQGTVTNQRVVGGCTDDGSRGSLLKSGDVFLLAERNQGEPFADLLNDAYALRAGDPGPERQAGERT